jgi:molybdopterin molybdotransferase
VTCGRHDLGFEPALALVLQRVRALPPAPVSVGEACGLVADEPGIAAIDCPTTTVAAKDGFAVVSDDLAHACAEHPVELPIVGSAHAGGGPVPEGGRGRAVKVTSGTVLPAGTDAVLGAEFAREARGRVVCLRDAHTGRNVLSPGRDLAAGTRIVDVGEVVTPGIAGLLAAGGVHELRLVRRPRVAVLATGDEIVAPGEPLPPGRLYASNLVTLLAWLARFRMPPTHAVAGDRPDGIRGAIESLLPQADAILTTGGVWRSERDVTPAVLDELGWEMVFHRVRIGPGKAVAFGLLAGKPVFCLPGGPASNETAFLELALPGLLRLCGLPPSPFPERTARLAAAVSGDRDWTQFFRVRLSRDDRGLVAAPLALRDRLDARARAPAVLRLPEGVERIEAGAEVRVRLLDEA